MLLVDKIAYLFNNYYSSFLKAIKESDEELRLIVKANYKMIDKKSSSYCQQFADQLNPHITCVLKKNVDDCKDSLVCTGVTIGALFEKVKEDKQRDVLWNFIFTLMVFAWLFKNETEDQALFEQVVKILGNIQNNADENVIKEDIKEILDDEVRELLLNVSTTAIDVKINFPEEKKDGEQDTELPDIFAGLQNSKIANLAKEISKDIDVSSLQSQDPQDMIKNMLDFSSSNNVLGNIIGKVSSTLHEKMSTGELNQQDLLSEAMTMMNLMNNSGANNLMSQFTSNPMFSQMMKAFQGGRATPRNDVIRTAGTRDRLRKKLDQKKKNME